MAYLKHSDPEIPRHALIIYMKAILITFALAGVSHSFADPLTSYTPSTFVCDAIPPRPAKRVLAVSGKYLTKPYADSQLNVRWKTGESFDCTTFITKVLQDAGFFVSTPFIKMINITLLTSQSEINEAVKNNDTAAAGVVWALLCSHQGTEVSDTDDLREGDIVQFWSRKVNGDMAGHSAIVSERLADGKFRLLGAHGSYLNGGEVGFKPFDLRIGAKNDNRTVSKVFAVRPKSP